MSIGTYLVKGTAGNVGTPGAPIMEFHLLVVVGSGHVSGHVEITQALPPPNGEILVNNVHGHLYELGQTSPSDVLVVVLQGTYPYTLPPPAIGTVEEHFNAVLHVNREWNGRGGFSYGGHHVRNVPVKKLP